MPPSRFEPQHSGVLWSSDPYQEWALSSAGYGYKKNKWKCCVNKKFSVFLKRSLQHEQSSSEYGSTSGQSLVGLRVAHHPSGFGGDCKAFDWVRQVQGQCLLHYPVTLNPLGNLMATSKDSGAFLRIGDSAGHSAGTWPSGASEFPFYSTDLWITHWLILFILKLIGNERNFKLFFPQ